MGYSNCLYDSCTCDEGGDCECFCTVISAFALACSEVGIPVRWRTPDICPLMCEEFNKKDVATYDCTWHYKECGSPCPDTCLNNSPHCSLPLPCIEGCFPVC